MGKTFLLGCAAALIGTYASSAAAQNNSAQTCTTLNQDVAHIRITEKCAARRDGFANRFEASDAYYAAHVSVAPGPAFNGQAQFGKKSTPGKILGRILSDFLHMEKARSLSIAWVVTEGTKTYPPVTLLSFTRNNDGDWISSYVGEDETLLHHLPIGGRFSFKIVYLYSDRANVDFKPARELLGKALPVVADAAADPIFQAAQQFTTSIMNVNAVSSKDEFTQELRAAEGEAVRWTLALKDPSAGANSQNAETMATLTISLRGKRSLLTELADFPQMDSTLPTPEAAQAKVDNMTSYFLQGKPATWSIIPATLAATDKAFPIGDPPTAETLGTFCQKMREQLSGQGFNLSPPDALLVAALVVNRTTKALQKTVNPYPVCFTTPAERAFIKAKLGFDVDRAIQAPAAKGIHDANLLQLLGCWLRGSDCDLQAGTLRARLSNLLAPQIKLIRREGLPPEHPLIANLGEDPALDRETFLNKTNAAFARFHDWDATAGNLLVNVTNSSPDLLVTGSVRDNLLAEMEIRLK